LIELLEAAAALDDEAAAVITNRETVSYGDLLAGARSVASELTQRGIERFAIVHQDAALVSMLLAGSSLAGAEACVYPPLETEQDAAELSRRFDHEIVVADEELAGDFEVIPTDALIHAGDGAAPGEPPEARPLLVLTTGTTGIPRGVRHDWRRILRALGHVRTDPGHRWLLAYGLQQFGGLQVLLHVFGAAATLVAPEPRRPRQGLAAMREHGVDYASATPTFWRFLLAEMRSDGGPAPALAQVTLSGEAVPAGLLEEVRAAFPAARVSQIYAANEFGSTGSVRDARNGLPVEVLERGDDADVAFRIEGDELWVRSRVGMLGYYGDPPVDADGWRPTGDLVEI
jgi:acyl-CoA synthetase (AMP-forming)/AMP-acid ligase II